MHEQKWRSTYSKWEYIHVYVHVYVYVYVYVYSIESG